MAEIRFRRIRGRVVPIKTGKALAVGRAVSGGVKTVKGAKAIAAGASLGILKKSTVTPKRGLQALGFATSVADGVLSGATFFGGGATSFFLGQGAGVALSLGSSAANAASYAGRGHKRARIRGAIRQEAINTVAGNAAFVGTMLAIPSSRRKLIEYGQKAIKFVAKRVVK